MYIHKNTYTYNHSTRWPYKTTAVKYRSPLLRLICAQGGTIHIYIYNIYNIYNIYIYNIYNAGTFSQEHCSVFIGRWLQCSPADPCSIKKFYIYADGTHTHTLTSVPDNSLTHNTWTHTDPRNTCTNSIFTPAPLPHHSFTHSNFTHDSISHTPLLHTFTHTPFTNNTFTRNSFAHLTSICISAHRSSTISCLFPAFPIPSSPFFGYLLEEVDVGLSGPLITMSWCFLTSSNNALESIQYSIEHAWIPWNAEGGVFDVLHLFHWAWIPQ